MAPLRDLKNLLRNAGIEPGETLCVFSDITTFGIPSALQKQVREKGLEFLLSAYLETFESLVGSNGLLVMPTFTYSATKGETFEVNKTPSTVGVLTEYFRKQQNVYRSRHPIFSFAATGRDAASYTMLTDFDSLGETSLLGKLYKRNAWYLLFGISMEESATFVLYSEQKYRVYYRYIKKFPALIKDGNSIEAVEVPYCVRDLSYDYDYGWGNLETRAKKEGIVQELTWGAGSLLLTRAQAIDTLIGKQIARDKDFLVAKK